MHPHSTRKSVLHDNAPKTSSRPAAEKRSKRERTTLEELYREVHAKSAQHTSHQYVHKNAEEIESIMRNNRSLIDSRRHHRL